MTSRRRSSRLLNVFAVISLLLAACSGEDTPTDAAPAGGDTQLSVAVASFDIAVGDDQRFMAAAFTPQQELLGFGTVRLQVGPLDDDGSVTVREEVTARWLPVPGLEPDGDGSAPRLLIDEPGSGVYEAQVDLDEPGTWGLRLVAELADGTVRTGQTIFTVLAEHEVVTPGDAAPTRDNPTLADAEAGALPATAVDSRARDAGDIPHPHLHDTRVADALDEGRPVVIAIATPVYCSSRFCGPLTDVLADIAPDYEGTAEFVHIEVWKNFDEQQLNSSAAAWIQTETGGNEPWVFLLDGDGTVVSRWDNVLDVDALRAHLDHL
ncbi:MAG: hypothetical protein WD377_02230 [Nitriliruptoraceae bacterium]